MPAKYLHRVATSAAVAITLLCATLLLARRASTRHHPGHAAQEPAPAPPTPAQHDLDHPVEPTVTPEMGDVGGKFFGRTPDPARTRRYYIAAEPQIWDYAPQDRDPVFGKPLPPPLAAKRRSSKLRYEQYTDDTFQARVMKEPRLGLLGPALRGVVGDYLVITFLNRTPRPLSLHPHGVKYDKDSEGAYYQPKPGLGAAVAPGARFTYVWHLNEWSGPQPGEPSSKGWLYHSHVNGDEETDLGLIGFIIVTDPRRARRDATPVDVDREQAALFMIFDESGVGQAAKEAAEYGLSPGAFGGPKTWAELQEKLELGSRHAINGYVFGNLPGLEMNEGERVRWYLFALGSEKDLHTAHWHGLRVVEEGRRRTDVVELLPATMKVADMVADNPGTWLFHCHVADHMMEGMYAPLVVHPKGAARGGAPQPAFFGLKQAQQSLRVQRAEAAPGCAAKAAGPCHVTIEGAVTVYEAFSVFVQPVRVQLGGKTVTFRPDARGLAHTPDGGFRVKNAHHVGVVYGRLMEFEVTLTGPEWLRELRKLGLGKGAARRGVAAPLILQVGPATHSATAPITLRAR
jgi:hypothetical protein